MIDKIKTRNLSIYKYFDQLQKEYIIAELRRKIYPSLQDKKYYKKVMFFKKQKIEDISLRNSINSIFDDKETRFSYYSQIYNESGFPNFSYQNKKEEEELKEKDRLFYYMENSEVKVELNEKIKIGILKSISFKTSTALIEFSDKTQSMIGIDYITRIL